MGAATKSAVKPPSFKLISGLRETPPEGQEFIRWVPVRDLKAAAGKWGEGLEALEIGWRELERGQLKKGMFIAWVTGESMEPMIPSGSWCLFRPCPAGSRNGRILLVQFNSMSDPETGGHYTVKKYYSEKTITEDGWHHEKVQLRPLNKAMQPMDVPEHEASEFRVVGEFVEVVE